MSTLCSTINWPIRLAVEHPERITDRDVVKILGWNEIQPVLPLIGRPYRDEKLVAALLQSVAEVDKVALTAAESFCR